MSVLRSLLSIRLFPTVPADSEETDMHVISLTGNPHIFRLPSDFTFVLTFTLMIQVPMNNSQIRTASSDIKLD